MRVVPETQSTEYKGCDEGEKMWRGRYVTSVLLTKVIKGSTRFVPYHKLAYQWRLVPSSYVGGRQMQMDTVQDVRDAPPPVGTSLASGARKLFVDHVLQWRDLLSFHP